MLLTEIFIAVLLGLILGSFSSAMVYRVPRKINWVSRRSFCTSCNRTLDITDLIPVLSWLACRGKCRCGSRISIKYPLIELLHVLCILAAYAGLGFSADFVFIVAVLPFLMALLIIDLEHMILPNSLVLITVIIGTVRIVYMAFMHQSIFTAVHYGSAAMLYAGLSWFLGWFLSKILKKEALGFGDVKFFFVAGLWLGLPPMPYFLILTGLIGVSSALLWRIFQKRDIFPFGPALIVSLCLLLISQGPVIL